MKIPHLQLLRTFAFLSVLLPSAFRTSAFRLRTSAFACLCLLPSSAFAQSRVPVAFSGGHDTDGRDRGRPVVLVAAGLGVTPEVFREAFSHVHPAGPGSGGPTDAEARANKAALMAALGKYGVTDEQINTVSNYYRYRRDHDELWTHRDAKANALVKDGVVVGYEIVDGGAGYTTPPTVSVPGVASANAIVDLAFGKDLAANGSIRAISVADKK